MRLKPDTLRDEINQVLEILQRQKARLDEGIPGEELPANDMNIEIFQFQLHGELHLAAQRLLAVVEVLDS